MKRTILIIATVILGLVFLYTTIDLGFLRPHTYKDVSTTTYYYKQLNLDLDFLVANWIEILIMFFCFVGFRISFDKMLKVL